jgi:acyl-coenzyme A thioesterase PaaI-like protein
MMLTQPIQNFYPDDESICFGCGRHNAHGLHILSYWEAVGDLGGAVATFTPQPYHTGYPGFVYGGLIASLIDCHSIATAIAAMYHAAGREPGTQPRIACVTGTLTVKYLLPTPISAVLTVRSVVRELSGRKAVIASSLLADGVECAQGEVIAVRPKGGA